VSDVIDLANEHADYLLQVSIAQHQRRTVGHTTSAGSCEACGVDIPEARRAAVLGCQTCIDCQQLRERRA
jgi:phage/conjugal plasmid C-4 type zinc finger TraR family protein